MSTLFRLANTSVTTALTLAMFYLGANEVLDGAMTVGMLFAFNTYAGTFSSRFFSVTDTFVNVKMLNLHTDRLSDIVLEPIESMGESHVDINLVTPDINLLDVKFRYAEGEPYVFDGVRLQVPYGQSIALIGPSGCGKTTLCKLILGLHSPSEGTILLGDVPISRFGLSNYRRMIGTVMQDDVLLSGSVSENISFYSMSPDEDFIHDCARASNIHDEIMALPMGYQTLIGELGSTLSGGQKQRVLLARALYKKPTILVLDEATSHLDIANEHKVNAALGGLKLTKIVIAHRPETILAAQRIVELKNGKIFEISHYDFVQSSAQSTAWNHAEKFLHAVES